MKRRSQGNNEALDNRLNSFGLALPERQAKLLVVKQFLEKNPVRPILIDDPRPIYQLTMEEFSSQFAKSALELTKYESADKAIALLEKTYETEILKALKEQRLGIPIKTLLLYRFRTSDLMNSIRKYCKVVRINLDLQSTLGEE